MRYLIYALKYDFIFCFNEQNSSSVICIPKLSMVRRAGEHTIRYLAKHSM